MFDVPLVSLKNIALSFILSEAFKGQRGERFDFDHFSTRARNHRDTEGTERIILCALCVSVVPSRFCLGVSCHGYGRDSGIELQSQNGDGACTRCDCELPCKLRGRHGRQKARNEPSNLLAGCNIDTTAAACDCSAVGISER
jgi:hypothetical protein